MMRLCIADPPYPPRLATRYDVPGGRLVSRSRARRYYGDGTRAQGERPADFHPAAGAKPAGWTHWVLDALGYEPGDSVTDLFPGSGAVSQAIRTYAPTLDGEIL